MIFPAYVHFGDDEHAHGVTIPDFDGCFTTADDYADVPRNIQDALELFFEEEGIEIPEPSDLNTLASDSHFSDGVWMLVDVDVGGYSSKPQRLSVSLPSHIVIRSLSSEWTSTRHAII